MSANESGIVEIVKRRYGAIARGGLWAGGEDDNHWLLPGRNSGASDVCSRLRSRVSEVAREEALGIGMSGETSQHLGRLIAEAEPLLQSDLTLAEHLVLFAQEETPPLRSVPFS